MNKRHLIKLLGLTVLVAIGVMAVSASAAQAKWLFLLNGTSVLPTLANLLKLTFQGLLGLLEAENGLKIHCKEFTGTVSAALENDDKAAVGKFSVAFIDCFWVGSEATCTIKDGVKGQIKAGGTGELTMTGSETFVLAKSAPGEPFATVLTEGAFCTIPEEEEITGALRCKVSEPTVSATPKKCNLETDPSEPLKLGNSKVNKCDGEVHIRDENVNATLAFHLVNL